MSHTFTDSQDRSWPIPVTVGSIRRVQKTLDLNLANATEPAGCASGGNSGGGGEGNQSPLLTRLAIDPALLVDVVYVLVQPHAEERGVDDLQFGEAIDGEAYGRMAEAFWSALTDFFQGTGRTEIVRAIRRQTEILTEASRRAGDRIDALNVDIDAALDASMRGNSASKSPDDSA